MRAPSAQCTAKNESRSGLMLYHLLIMGCMPLAHRRPAPCQIAQIDDLGNGLAGWYQASQSRSTNT